MRPVVWHAVALLGLLSGCTWAEEYQAAQSAWETRNAQGPANCPATRRSNGTCISDGGP